MRRLVRGRLPRLGSRLARFSRDRFCARRDDSAETRSGVAAPAPAVSADEQRAFLKQYCLACHSERAKAAGMDSARKLTIDALDPANVAHDAKTWELVVRKLRAGMMPPAGDAAARIRRRSSR